MAVMYDPLMRYLVTKCGYRAPAASPAFDADKPIAYSPMRFSLRPPELDFSITNFAGVVDVFYALRRWKVILRDVKEDEKAWLQVIDPYGFNNRAVIRNIVANFDQEDLSVTINYLWHPAYPFYIGERIGIVGGERAPIEAKVVNLGAFSNTVQVGGFGVDLMWDVNRDWYFSVDRTCYRIRIEPDGFKTLHISP